MTSNIWDWLGKSAGEPGGLAHPAILHMLDVGAVAEQLIQPFRFSRRFQDALISLVALHDLGKVSESFRAMLELGRPQTHRHWELSEALFFLHDDLLEAWLGGTWRARQDLYAAVAGHHGRPSKLDLGGQPGPPRHAGALYNALKAIGTGREPARAVIEAIAALWPQASLAEFPLSHTSKSLSWWLPGLCAAADWIGSNSAWFPAHNGPRDLKVYLEETRGRARDAVEAAGLAGSTVRSGPTFDFTLRPLQTACAEIDLPEGPMLAVIEEETGAGKTEAALILAHRMLQAGKGRGVYFALPTMATADAMFRRTSATIGRLLTNPSLTLAHGRAGLSAPFRDLVTVPPTAEMAPGCTDWLYESRRRALLADVGVGTIDQALMSVLPVKHQTLRHFGLSSKILIVDEVHEMGEPYIGKELERLLEMHRAAGGSAILLTATLPLKLRETLLATYDATSGDSAYPALTLSNGASVTHYPPDPRPKKGRVEIRRIETVDAALDVISDAAAQGAACVWVRNAVDDAIEAVTALRTRGIEASLLHARFTLADRKRIEAEVLCRAGRDGQGREGYVLIGTQVLEASLDLDFDVMVSDLAPVASVLQRAGRLWRHMDLRPGPDRPVSHPLLHILSPDPSALTKERWLQETLGGGAYVYDPVMQWRSATALFRAGGFTAPEDLRSLIEAVYGPEAPEVPEVLERADLEGEGSAVAKRSIALHNLVDLAAGYRKAGRGEDDTRYPTRLGQESRKLTLARVTPDGLNPWALGTDPEEAWTLSEVSVSARRLQGLELPDQGAEEIQALLRTWPEWRRESVLLCPVGADGRICEGLSYDADRGIVFAASTRIGDGP